MRSINEGCFLSLEHSPGAIYLGCDNMLSSAWRQTWLRLIDGAKTCSAWPHPLPGRRRAVEFTIATAALIRSVARNTFIRLEDIMKYVIAILTAAMAALAVSPGYAADAQHGLDLAKRWCASCHLVSPDQQRASADVPSFAAISRSPNFNAARLAYFLLDPHPKMPELGLSRAAANDLAAYIASLKK